MVPRTAIPRPEPAALDVLNFFLADVRDGLGPFVGTSCAATSTGMRGGSGSSWQHLSSAPSWRQTPAGALVDRTRHKGLAVAIAAAIVAAGCRLLYLVPASRSSSPRRRRSARRRRSFRQPSRRSPWAWWGAAMPRRTGRNEAFNHGGNVIAAALVGVAAYLLGYGAMFVLVAALAAVSAAAVLLIRERDIDHDLARGADDGDGDGARGRRHRRAFQGPPDRNLHRLGRALPLRQRGDAPARRPEVERRTQGRAPVLMSACIIAAQVVMVPSR